MYGTRPINTVPQQLISININMFYQEAYLLSKGTGPFELCLQLFGIILQQADDGLSMQYMSEGGRDKGAKVACLH